jgi:hypothetical protein
MDALNFLKSRTNFIRFFYTESMKGFGDVKRRIENALTPLDKSPHSEIPSRRFLRKWLDAEVAAD